MCMIAVSFRLHRITSNRLTRTTSSNLPAHTTFDCRAGMALPFAMFHGRDARGTHGQDARATFRTALHGRDAPWDSRARCPCYSSHTGPRTRRPWDPRAGCPCYFFHGRDTRAATGGGPLYVTAITASAGAPVKAESGVCRIAGRRFQRSRRPEAGSGLLFGPAAGPTWAGGRRSSIMYSVSSIGRRHIAYITQLAQVWLCLPNSYKAQTRCVHGVLGVTVA